jgi:hypothetical protein
MTFFPLIFLAILIASYITHEKIIRNKNYTSNSQTSNYAVSAMAQ